MLEGYITPLLTSYLQKYVKNIKPSDLKLSLWGGDVVLNNLELKLDVLEELVPIPIRFVSGRIRELKIHVPWTALSYEAVVVSIDTIECVLEWDDGGPSRKKSSVDTYSDSRTASDLKAEQQEVIATAGVTPGYVQGLLNKITNNFTLSVTNLVLKYVEDDMVLSVSIPEVDFSPANADWEKAFADVSQTSCVLRKLVNVRDLTLCLDGRNESGGIDVYQEPLLYKCSFVCRMLLNSDPAAIDQFPLGTSIELLMEHGELGFNDWQLPKFTAFIFRFISLYKDKVAAIDALATKGHMMVSGSADHESPTADGRASESLLAVPSNDPDQSSSQLDDSWSAWAWTLVGGDDGAKNPVEARASRLQREKRFTLAFFVRHGTITLKQLHGTQRSSTLRRQKCIGVPCLVWDLHLATFQIINEGKHFFDLRFGIGSIEASWIRNATAAAEAELFFQLGRPPARNADFLEDSLFRSSLPPSRADSGTDVDGGSTTSMGQSLSSHNMDVGPVVPSTDQSVPVASDDADMDVGLRLYRVRDELKESSAFEAFWYSYRYVLPYSDRTVPGQQALEKFAAMTGKFPSSPPMAGEGGFGDGIVESTKQRLMVGPSWLLLSEDVMQCIGLFTKFEDNNKATSQAHESSVDSSTSPVYISLSSFQRATTVIHATFSKVQILYSVLPAEPLPRPVQRPAQQQQQQHAQPPASPVVLAAGPSGLPGNASSSFKWAPITPTAKTFSQSSDTGGHRSSAFRPRTVLWVDASRIDWQVTRAMYWPRLARAPPTALKVAVLPAQCYSENVVKSFGTSGGFAWLGDSHVLSRKTCFIQPTTLSLYLRRLLAPESLTSELVLQAENRIELPRLVCEASLAELILAARFLRLATGDMGLSRREKRMAVEALHIQSRAVLSMDPESARAGQNLIQASVEGVQYSSYSTPSVKAQSGQVSSIELSVRQADSQQNVTLAAGPSWTGAVPQGHAFTSKSAAHQQTAGETLLQFTLQQPLQTSASVGTRGLCLVKLAGMAVNCDTELQAWLITSLDNLHRIYSDDPPAFDSPARAPRPRIVRHISQASLSGLAPLALDDSESDHPMASTPSHDPIAESNVPEESPAGDGASSGDGTAGAGDVGRMAGWFAALSNSIVQVSADPIVLFWPSDSLAAFQQASPAGDIVSSVCLGCFTSAIAHPPLPPTLVFCLPAVQLMSHNLASSGLRLAIEQTLPCLSQVRLENMVDAIPVRQLHGDCLPCAVSLFGMSAYTISPRHAPKDGDSVVEVSSILQATGLHVLLAASHKGSSKTASDETSRRPPPPPPDSMGTRRSSQLSAAAADGRRALSVSSLPAAGSDSGGDSGGAWLSVSGVVIHGNAEAVCLNGTQQQMQLLQSVAAGWLRVSVAVFQSLPVFSDIPLANIATDYSSYSAKEEPAIMHRVAEQYDMMTAPTTDSAYSVSNDETPIRGSSVKSQAGSHEAAAVPATAKASLPVPASSAASHPLTMWVQCTLPLLQVCVRSAQTSITLSLEDLSVSIDACGSDVDGRYLVGDFGVSHQTLNTDGMWVEGPWTGVFFTRGSPDIFDPTLAEQDGPVSIGKHRESVGLREDVKTRAFLSVRYNTKSTLGARRDGDECAGATCSDCSPWKGELHVTLKPCTAVACCPVLNDIMHVFQLSADGAECVQHVTSLLPVATRRLKASGGGDSLVLPCLFLDVSDITVVVPSACGVAGLDSASEEACRTNALVLNLAEAYVGPSPDNPISPLVLEKFSDAEKSYSWRRSLLANQLVCKDVQLEAMFKGVTVAVASWGTIQQGLRGMAVGRQADSSAEPDSGQVPALEWNKSESQQRDVSSSGLTPLLSAPCCQVTVALAWHLSQLSGLLSDPCTVDLMSYRVGYLVEMSVSQMVTLHVGQQQLDSCLSAWENNIQPLISVISKLFRPSADENVVPVRDAMPMSPMSPMSPPPPLPPPCRSTPVELTMTGQGVALNLSFSDIGTWSAVVQQPVLVFANLLSSVTFQTSIHDLKFTVHPMDTRGVMTVLETRRGCSISRSGVTPSFFKFSCHGRPAADQGSGFVPDNLDVSLGRPVRVSVTVEILDTLALTLQRLLDTLSCGGGGSAGNVRPASSLATAAGAGASAGEGNSSMDYSLSSFAEYATPVDTPSKLGGFLSVSAVPAPAAAAAAAAVAAFPVLLNVSASQVVLEVFGVGETHIQLVVGNTVLQLERHEDDASDDGAMPYMRGQLSSVAVSACLVSGSLVSPASTYRHRLVLPCAVATSQLLLWRLPASGGGGGGALCWQASASTSDMHLLCCQKRVQDLQTVMQSLRPTVDRLSAVLSTRRHEARAPPAKDPLPFPKALPSSIKQDQMVRCELAAGVGDGFVMPAVGQVSFWTQHLVNPPRASMTWKYALPRCVHSLDVMPVPWHDADVDSVPAELQVWHDVTQRFERVLDFELFVAGLEQVSVDAATLLSTAGTTWRIEATCTTSQVEPQLLAACILVHSSVAHARRASLAGPVVKLHLFNAYTQLDAGIPGRPPTTLHPSFPPLQEFAVASLEAWSVQGSSNVLPCTDDSARPCLAASANLLLETVDFGSLQLMPCLSVEPVTVTKDRSVGVDIGACRLDVSSSALHTLLRSSKLWQVSPSAPTLVRPVSIGQATSDQATTSAAPASSTTTTALWTSSLHCHEPLLHHYLICNDTYSTLLIGQAETDECVTLRPRETLAYSWHDARRTHHLQVATMPQPDSPGAVAASVGGAENTHPSNPTKWCEPFAVDAAPTRVARWVLTGREGQEYAAEPARVLVDVMTLSSVQRHVLLRGAAHFGNYLPRDIDVGWWFRSRDVQCKLDDTAKQRPPGEADDFTEEVEQDKRESQLAREIVVPSSASTLSWIVPQNCVLVVKLRFAGAQSWSGGVPFQCLPDGHQFQTMAIPTGLKWPLLQIYFHMRVVNHVRGAVPLFGSVAPLMQLRNHMPSWCAVHMSRQGSDDAPFSSWIPPAGGQLYASHIGSQDCYSTAVQVRGLDYMSPANLPLSCNLRQDLPSVQPKPSVDVRLVMPEQRAEDALQTRWPHIQPTGPVAVAAAKIATVQYPREQHMLKYIDLTVGQPRPIMVVDAEEPVMEVENSNDADDGTNSSTTGSEGKFQSHYACSGIVSVHRMTAEMETLQVELAPWCLVVNRTPRVVLLSLGRNQIVALPPQHVIVPPNFNWGFNVGVQLDGVSVWSRHLISLTHRQPAGTAASSGQDGFVKTLSNEEQYRKLVFNGQDKRATMIAYTCARFGTQTVVLTEHFVLVNQTGRKLVAWSAYHQKLVGSGCAVCVPADENVCTALAPSPVEEDVDPDPQGPFICVALAPQDELGRTKLPVAFDADHCSAPIALGNEILRQPFGMPLPAAVTRTHGETSGSHGDSFSGEARRHEVAPGAVRSSLPLVICVQPHQGTNYAVVAVDSAPQFVLENQCDAAVVCQEVDSSELIGDPLRIPPRACLHWQPFSALIAYPSVKTTAVRPTTQVQFRLAGDGGGKEATVVDLSHAGVTRAPLGYVQVAHGHAGTCCRVVVSPAPPADARKALQHEVAHERASVALRECSVVVHEGHGADVSASLGLCLRGVACKVSSQSHGRHSLNLTVAFVQAENLRKSEDMDFPVVLARQVDPISERARRNLSTSGSHDASSAVFVGVDLLRDNFPAKVVVQLPRLVLHVEDTLLAQLTALGTFAGVAMRRNEVHAADTPLQQVSSRGLPAPLAKVMPAALHPLRVGEWSVTEMHVMLTMHTARRVFVSIDRSPLRLEPLRLWPGVTSPVTLLETASLHYISVALSSLGWLVSSLELLGSPGGFVRSVGDGVRDLVQLPYQGLSQGPGSFLTGLGGGTSSLLRHISAGVLTSLSHFAESAARNLDNLSLDEQHAAQQQRMRRRGASEIGLRSGLQSLGLAWLGAVAGLASHPLQPFLAHDDAGAGTGAAAAVAKTPESGGSVAAVTGGLKMVGSSLVGVGRGLMGAVTKPVSGAMDLIAHTGQGLLATMELIATLEAQMAVVALQSQRSSFQRVLHHCLLEDVIWFSPCVLTMAERGGGGDSDAKEESASPLSPHFPLSRHNCILLLSQSAVQFVSVDAGMRSTNTWLYNLCDVEFRDCPFTPLPAASFSDEVDVCLLPHSESTTPLSLGHSSASRPQANFHSDCIHHIALPSPLSAKLLFTFVVVLSKQHHFYVT